jgi:hypothetical protein
MGLLDYLFSSDGGLSKLNAPMPVKKKANLFDKPVKKNAVESIIEQDMADNGTQPEQAMPLSSGGLLKDSNGLEVPQQPNSKLWQKLLQIGLGGVAGGLSEGALTPSLLSSIDSPDERYQNDLKKYQQNRLFDQNERKIKADTIYKNKLLGLSGTRNAIAAYNAGMGDDEPVDDAVVPQEQPPVGAVRKGVDEAGVSWWVDANGNVVKRAD